MQSHLTKSDSSTEKIAENTVENNADLNAALTPELIALKSKQLTNWFANANITSAIVALSGGVDSSLVAYVAHQALGQRALAVTSCSSSLTRADLALTQQITARWGMAHQVIETQEMDNPNYRANPTNRCYYCKSTLYDALATIASEQQYAVVLNGSNADDFGDHRPGLKAAEERHVRAPLAECGFGKPIIRSLAAELGIETADKPQAACLSSRVPYGLSITPDMLGQIERAEQYLKSLGFGEVRVRHHNEVARIEVPPQHFSALLTHAHDIQRTLKGYGYRFVSLDLAGFKSGSLNVV